ncbi:MAG: V-type ATP synthase subunit D [bacterium]|nr:V-type ATP synthase subunit D [bacterium]
MARVNATRMELLKLKNRLKMARRGHKLLKDKRDELMKVFLARVRETRGLRGDVEKTLERAYRELAVARAAMTPGALAAAVSSPEAEVVATVELENVMSVIIPRLEAEVKGNPHPYGLGYTTAELDTAVRETHAAFRSLVKLAEAERAVELLAEEIEKTRRRVNALEYVLIPQLQGAVRSIAMKLSEMERSNASRLMKIKDIVRAK